MSEVRARIVDSPQQQGVRDAFVRDRLARHAAVREPASLSQYQNGLAPSGTLPRAERIIQAGQGLFDVWIRVLHGGVLSAEPLYSAGLGWSGEAFQVPDLVPGPALEGMQAELHAIQHQRRCGGLAVAAVFGQIIDGGLDGLDAGKRRAGTIERHDATAFPDAAASAAS